MKKTNTLALVEFLPPNRFKSYRSEHYPYHQRIAQQNGMKTHWLVLGLLRQPGALDGHPMVYDPEPEEFELLLNRLRSLDPGHITVNERLSEKRWQELKRTCPDAKIRMVQDKNKDFQFEEEIPAPDYSREVLNERVWDIRPLTHILVGPLCLFKSPLKKNPYFEGVDLKDCINPGVCTFCTRGYEKRLKERADTVALRQLQAFLKTKPPKISFEFLIYGVSLWYRIDHFFRELISQNYPPSVFHFTCRIDEILRFADRVEALFPLLKEHGHVIALSDVGLENFSPEENERFNKKITPEMAIDVARKLAEWEQSYPETLQFSKYGGFGCIAYTPWTKKEDIRLNIQGLRALSEFFPLSTLNLYSRVQFLPGTALTKLAFHEGLISEDFDDIAYDSGCVVHWDQVEYPWKFIDPDVAFIYRFSRRLADDPNVPEDDTEKIRINDWLSRENLVFQHILLDIIEAAVEYIEKNPGNYDLDSLLHELSKKEFERSEKELRLLSLNAKVCSIEEIPPDLLFLLKSTRKLLEKFSDTSPLFKDTELIGFDPIRINRNPVLRLHLRDKKRPFILLFHQKSQKVTAFQQSAFFKVVHDADTPVDSLSRQQMVNGLLKIFDGVYKRYQGSGQTREAKKTSEADL